MFQEHYPPLAIGYFIGLAGWLLANQLMPRVWPRQLHESFKHPWRELGIALVGAVGVLAVGQLWSAGIRLPEQGAVGPLLASVNQLFIFAPILLVPIFRRHSWSAAWLPHGKLVQRLLTGFILALVAVTAYSLFREGAEAPWVMVGRIWRYDNFDKMVQVFLEDLTIAILFVRLASAIGNRWAVAVVAILFAAGHIPALLSQGTSWSDLVGLVRDAGLGLAVIMVLQRSRDIVWFWFIHYCLDMTQFAKISGVG